MSVWEQNDSRRFSASELAEAAETSLATVKYYLREGLLARGDQSHEQRRYYDGSHLRRLLLLRTLREVGGLPIATLKQVVEALDHSRGANSDVVALALDAVGTQPKERPAEWQATADEVDVFLRARGIEPRPGAAARDKLIESVLAIRRHSGEPVPLDVLTPYADAAAHIARQEIEQNADVLAGADATAAILVAVLGTILFEPVLTSLRRLMAEREHRTLIAQRRGERDTAHDPRS